MPGLPNAHLAIVGEEKVTRYLLAADHPAGRTKAAFFRRFGFSRSGWQDLRDALLSHAASARIVSVEQTQFGKKYMVQGRMPSPDGRRPSIRAIWFVPTGEVAPRLVTAYPRPGDER